MKTEKLVKKINKAIEKTPILRACLTKTVDGTMSFKVDAKNRTAFRFFRDQLEGTVASEINYVYGIGGRMTVDVHPCKITIALYSDTGRLYNRFVLISESESNAA